MHADALIVGEFIKATEFGSTLPAEPTWTIRGWEIVEVQSLKPGASSDKMVPKGIIYFNEQPRGWVINRTNVEILKVLIGEDVDAWVGRRITLHAQKVSLGREKVLGILVHGSPELTAERKVVVKLPKKAPQTFTLVPTGPRPAPRSDAPPPMDPAKFLQWIAHAQTERGGNWTPAQIATLLGCDADQVPADARRDIVARLKQPPPQSDDAPPPFEPDDEERARIVAEEQAQGGGK